MKKTIMIIFSLILISNTVFGALWYNDPASCPNEHATYPGQSCGSTNEICGVTGGTIQCYDTDTLPNPPNDVNSNSSYSGSYNGGFLIDCFAYDGSSPHCDNSTAYWCDRDSTCYDKGRVTQCESGKWSGDAGDISCQYCRSPYIVCDGDHEDADGCEVYPGVTNCPVGTHNNIDAGCTCVCDSGYYDCDASGAGGGDGCEVLDGGSCTTAYGTSGTWDGGSCTCIGSKSYFETGTNTQYGTASDENFFWGTMWGTTGYLAFLQNATTDKNFRIDVNANVYIDANYTGNCFLWTDGTSACTAPTGGTGDGNFYSIQDFNKLYWTQTDSNLTFYKQTDLNSLLQVSDFNGVYVSWIDSNQTFWKQVDLNSLLQIPDFNNMIINLGEGQGWNTGGTDTNWQVNDGADFNAQMDERYATQSDANIWFGRLGVSSLHEWIYSSDFNSAYAVVTRNLSLFGLDSDFNLLYARLGVSSLHEFIYSNDFNSAYGQIGTTTLSSWLFDSDFNNTYAKIDRDLSTMGLDTDFNSLYLGTEGSDSNIFVSGQMNADTNSWNIDINAGNNNIINVNDINILGDLNVLGNIYLEGDLNVLGNLHVDQNIIAESSLGKAMLIPDENRLCVGTEIVFCIGLTCNATGDCNANFEFI